jgi:hypothetical protein
MVMVKTLFLFAKIRKKNKQMFFFVFFFLLGLIGPVKTGKTAADIHIQATAGFSFTITNIMLDQGKGRYQLR